MADIGTSFSPWYYIPTRGLESMEQSELSPAAAFRLRRHRKKMEEQEAANRVWETTKQLRAIGARWAQERADIQRGL